eukprot:2731654-Pyramimonas_sp.AAC.1
MARGPGILTDRSSSKRLRARAGPKAGTSCRDHLDDPAYQPPFWRPSCTRMTPSCCPPGAGWRDMRNTF